MQRALSLDRSPAASVPLRFMFSAPAFLFAAALLLLWSGPAALISRWTPQALAVTHLLTLGALAHTMVGALMQILPVATGIHVAAPRLTAAVVHTTLLTGTSLLATAFLTGTAWQFSIATILLTFAVLCLLAAAAAGLWIHRRQTTKGAGEILAGVRLALVALLVTLILGAMLGGHLATGQAAPRQFTNLHAAWGLTGWVVLLVIAMSYQLIPMFQVTELYPRLLTRWLTAAVFTVLLLNTFNFLAFHNSMLGFSLNALLCVSLLVYTGTTLNLLRTRKRPSPDTTTLFWITAMISLAACVPVWLIQQTSGIELAPTLGVLFLLGFAWSVINGMLYKIIPFLTWFHSQRGLAMALPFIPKVKNIIPDNKARYQFYVHGAALALLLGASLYPAYLTRAGAIVLGVSAIWLLILMLGALHLLHQTKKRIKATLSPGRAPARPDQES